MKKFVLLIMMTVFSLSVFSQEQVRRVNVSDSVQVVVDSTYTVNGELKGIYYKIFDLSPRLVEQRFITKEQIGKVIIALEKEKKYESFLVRQGAKYIKDSLGSMQNLPPEDELVRKNANVVRLTNEIKMWKKIEKKCIKN